MSVESVRAFFADKAPDIAVIESPLSSATVALVAQAYGVAPARIAKTLSLRVGERVVLIVTSGTSRMDNKKVKALLGGKPKMLGLDEVADITGHEVGGVCENAAADLLRRLAAGVRRSRARRGLDAQRGAYRAVAHGGAGRRRMGRCVPGSVAPGYIVRGPGVTGRRPDRSDGPQRFVRDWLTFDDRRPVRLRRIAFLIATVAMFLIASALLAWFGNQLAR
jgi:Aminoacyl-tRNA editing domain